MTLATGTLVVGLHPVEVPGSPAPGASIILFNLGPQPLSIAFGLNVSIQPGAPNVGQLPPGAAITVPASDLIYISTVNVATTRVSYFVGDNQVRR